MKKALALMITFLLFLTGCGVSEAGGNHEFDYGMERFLELTGIAEFPYISCNFNKEGEPVFEPYLIKEFEGVKVAFVGITTPKTLTSSTPRYFQDNKGNFIYGFLQDETGEAVYAAVQKAVDDASTAAVRSASSAGRRRIWAICVRTPSWISPVRTLPS